MKTPLNYGVAKPPIVCGTEKRLKEYVDGGKRKFAPLYLFFIPIKNAPAPFNRGRCEGVKMATYIITPNSFNVEAENKQEAIDKAIETLKRGFSVLYPLDVMAWED